MYSPMHVRRCYWLLSHLQIPQVPQIQPPILSIFSLKRFSNDSLVQTSKLFISAYKTRHCLCTSHGDFFAKYIFAFTHVIPSAFHSLNDVYWKDFYCFFTSYFSCYFCDNWFSQEEQLGTIFLCEQRTWNISLFSTGRRREKKRGINVNNTRY